MKQLFAVVLVAALAAGVPARGAQTPDNAALRAQIARCAAVTDALNRLECYDRLARKLNATVPPAVAAPTPPLGSETAKPPPSPLVSAAPAAPAAKSLPPPGGKWQRKIERNDKGEITKVTLRLPAASETGSIGGDPVTLILRCLGTETSVTINWQNYVGENGVPVTLRVDGGDVRKLWRISADSSKTIYPGNAVKLIQSWSGTHELHARLNPYGGYAMTATFDLSGLEGALAPLRATCRW